MGGKVAVILVILLSAGGYYFYKKSHAVPPGAGGHPPGMMAMVMPVSVAEVIGRDIQLWREYSGRVAAVDAVEIRSRVSGPIVSIDFKDGATVQKGDLLVTIDPRPYAADVARAEAALAAAKAAADLSETRFKRAKLLIKDKAVSQSDYDLRKNELDVAKAQVESTRAGLETSKLNLDYTQIRSPITGRVSRAELTVGNLVEAGPNSPLLTTVVSQSPMYADFDIDEPSYLELAPEIAGDVSNIKVTMQLSGSGGRIYEGLVRSFDNQLNPAAGTVRARAVFSNDDGTLVPGLFARIRLGSARLQHAILITDRAISTDQSKKFVLVVGKDNKVEYREVKLGDTAGSLRIITEGLAPGEKIIVNGLQRARPGAEVKPELVGMEEMPPASGDAPKP